MNLRELEALLRAVRSRGWDEATYLRLSAAIAYVHRKQATAHKRHVFFKLRADEQREMLR